MIIMAYGEFWRQLSAAQYAALYPARPKALRTIAYGLRKLGATGDGSGTACPVCGQQLDAGNRAGLGNQVFTMSQPELAKALGVSVRTLRRYLPLFENYGILEVKRWRYRVNGKSPSSYRVFLGNVIPEGAKLGDGKYPISARERRKKDT